MVIRWKVVILVYGDIGVGLDLVIWFDWNLVKVFRDVWVLLKYKYLYLLVLWDIVVFSLMLFFGNGIVY